MTVSLSKTIAAGILALAALPAPAAGLELVMVDQPGCMYCAEWDRVIGPIYPKTPEGAFAPLRHIEKSTIGASGLTLARPVTFTPTFILVEAETEVARVEGYPGEDLFWAMLGLMLKAETEFEPVTVIEN